MESDILIFLVQFWTFWYESDTGHSLWVSEQEADNTVSCDCGTER